MIVISTIHLWIIEDQHNWCSVPNILVLSVRQNTTFLLSQHLVCVIPAVKRLIHTLTHTHT